MQLTQAITRAAQIRGDELATIDGTRRFSWRQTVDRVGRLAGLLRANGVVDGERVAILALNSDRYFEAYFAIPWAGGIFVPLNTRLAAPELLFALNDSGSSVLLVDQTFYPVIASIREQLHAVKAIIFADEGPPPAGLIPYEASLATQTPIPDAQRRGEDIAGICYTGGTTGRSKGVMLTHTNLVSNALSTIGQLKFDQHDRYLHAAPMFHLADGLGTWAFSIVAGTHVFARRLVPAEVLPLFGDHQISAITLVPTIIQMLLDAYDPAQHDLSSLKTMFYGASPMPEPLLKRAMALLPACDFYGAFGMTELAPIATVLHPVYHQAGDPRMRSVGQATLGVAVKVVDENDVVVPAGAIGEILIQGPNVMAGYWHLPEASATALRGGWMHSGDMGYMDEEGFLYIVDRKKDMIITGGENVYCGEVEAALYQHPDVAQAAVIGIPDEKWGEVVHAVVILKPDSNCTPAILIDHCRAHIAGYKCPRSIQLRAEPLPLSGAGKVLKSALRAPYWDGRKKQVN